MISDGYGTIFDRVWYEDVCFGKETAMKIPYGINSRFLLSGLNMPERCSKTETLTHKFRVGRFGAMLEDEMKATRLKSAFSLDKDVLQQLIRVVGKQMDNHLILAVLSGCGNSGLTGSWFEGIESIQVLTASINQHSLQKNDDSLTMDYTNRIIDHASKKYGVDADLIKAVIKVESDFDVKSTSSKGAMGLMQLMPETAGDLGVKNPYDPVENIMGGTRYLKMLLDRYNGDMNVALAAYNWGMGNVERNPGRLPAETKTYIARVNKHYRPAIT